MKHLFKLTMVMGLSVSSLALAQPDHSMKEKHQNMPMDCMKNMENMQGMKMDCTGNDASKAASLSEGVVEGIDQAKKSITLKHGAIENMNMGPMTMSFAVQDPSLLSKVKVGDKVKFKLENINNTPTVTVLTVLK